MKLLKSLHKIIKNYPIDVVEALFSVLVADKILNCASDSKKGNGECPDINDILVRNATLFDEFPEITDVIKKQSINKSLTGLIASVLDNIPGEDLLHIPGQVHEISMNYQKYSHPVLSKRKLQGSYYTPVALVRFMVRNAIEQVKNKYSSIDLFLNNLRIIDPACGGASFLIEIFEYLVNSGMSSITAIRSLYGMDIDLYAINLTIFLLTTVAYKKNIEIKEIKKYLQNQIKVGNFLIDFESTMQGNFDIVIGNPPYISNKLIPTTEKGIYKERYLSAGGQYDLSVLFMEKGLKILKKDKVLTYLTSNKFMATDYGKQIRKQLLTNYKIDSIIDISRLSVFDGVGAYPIILTVFNEKESY